MQNSCLDFQQIAAIIQNAHGDNEGRAPIDRIDAYNLACAFDDILLLNNPGGHSTKEFMRLCGLTQIHNLHNGESV